MENTILDFILRTNLFNFVIFITIIAYVYKKLDVNAMLKKSAEDVSERINNTEQAKTESEKTLSEIELTISHLEEEIDGIIKKSEENARLVGEKIIDEANMSAQSIRDNSVKTLENKTALLRNDILQRASKASVEIAGNHIKEELINNPDLHNRLIDESIEAIEGLDGVIK